MILAIIFSMFALPVGLVLLLLRRTRRAGKWLAASGLLVPIAVAVIHPAHEGTSTSKPTPSPVPDVEPVAKSQPVTSGITATEAPPKFVLYGEGTMAQNLRNMRAMDAVRSRLRDPDSAKFQNVYLHQGKSGVPVTCGEVNSRNGFGGFPGFQSFVSNSADITVMASDFKNAREFQKTWAQLCQ